MLTLFASVHVLMINTGSVCVGQCSISYLLTDTDIEIDTISEAATVTDDGPLPCCKPPPWQLISWCFFSTFARFAILVCLLQCTSLLLSFAMWMLTPTSARAHYVCNFALTPFLR